MLISESTDTRALELPHADELSAAALTALERHFQRALRRAEEMLGSGGGPREVALVEVCRASEAPTGKGPLLWWRAPLRDGLGEAVHALDGGVASAMVDALLGCPTTTGGDRLSALDREVLSEWARRLTGVLLGPVLEGVGRGGVQFEGTGGRRTGSELPVPPGGAEVRFRVRANEVDGDLALWLPVEAALRLARSGAGYWPSREALGEQLQSARVDVQARLITATLPVQDVASLEPGDVLALDVGPGDGAELLVNGSAKFAGKAGFMDGRLAFQVSGRADSGTT
ncbi:MAG: FliM/FliN family flagellar motor switch protein [Armatimonadota bacterium]